VSANALLTSWSPDDAIVALQLRGTRTALGFFTLGGKLERVGSEQYDLAMPYFSPDGKWVAYHSNSTGRYEVFIRSFPDGKTVRQLSSDGGVEPIWCRCGELFYRIGNRWMSSKIRTAPTLEWDPPRQVFQTEFLDTPGMSY